MNQRAWKEDMQDRQRGLNAEDDAEREMVKM